jgi:hypothetical protein
MTIAEIYKSLELEQGGEKNPIDLIHQDLPTKFMKIASDSKEFDLVGKMLNTMGPNHSNFTLELVEVYNLVNSAQKAENWAFRKIKSRLLWFGARMTDHAHILK